MSGGGDSSSSGNDSVSADVEAGLATESMSDYSVSEGGTGGDNEEYNTVMNKYGPGKNTPDYSLGDPDPNVDDPVDTGSNLVNNFQKDLESKVKGRSIFNNPVSFAVGTFLNPLNTIGGSFISTAYQTAKFNNLMGRPTTTGILDGGKFVTTGTQGQTLKGVIDEYQSSGDNDNQTQQTETRTVNTEGTGLPDPSEFIFKSIGSKNYIKGMYDDVKKSLYTARTQQGLLATNDSPYYDFLKINKLDRRIL